jgi:hypothetical protein
VCPTSLFSLPRFPIWPGAGFIPRSARTEITAHSVPRAVCSASFPRTKLDFIHSDLRVAREIGFGSKCFGRVFRCRSWNRHRIILSIHTPGKFDPFRRPPGRGGVSAPIPEAAVASLPCIRLISGAPPELLVNAIATSAFVPEGPRRLAGRKRVFERGARSASPGPSRPEGPPHCWANANRFEAEDKPGKSKPFPDFGTSVNG